MFNNHNKWPHRPLVAGCGLVEEDNIFDTNNSARPTAAPSFPLDIFPETIRNIIESLNEYENYNIDFTAASFLTVFAAAMGNTWAVRFMTGWISRPIIYMVLVGSPSCGKTPPLQQAVTPLLNWTVNTTTFTARRWQRTAGGSECRQDSARNSPCRRK